MSKINIRHLFILQTLLYVSLVLFSLAQYFPYIGMDFKYFIPRLIDSDLHYRINGLSIQWYTPSFGGGLPSYPNPQQIQFSLPQFLTLFFDPWIATLLSISIYSSLGMLGAFLLSSRKLGFSAVTSSLVGLLFLVNGFYLQHMGIGHFTFMAFPLLPYVLLALLSKRKPILNGILLSSIIAVLLYSGGFYLIIYFFFSSLLCLSLIYLFKPELFDPASLLKTIGWGSIFTIGLCASKLSAVLAFLQSFPRAISDTYHTSLLQSLEGIILQLLGTMALSPLGSLVGRSPKFVWDLLMTYTGSSLAFWELDTSISPILFFFLLAGALTAVWGGSTKKFSLTKTQWISGIFFLVFFELTLEFITTKGFFYPTLSQLPILRSLHVNPRYTSTLILPLALLGGFSLNHFFKIFRFSHGKELLTWIISMITIFLFASAYLTLPMDSLQKRQFYVAGNIQIYQQVRAGETFPILYVQDDLNDARVFDQNSSTLTPYEVLFGYGMGKFKHQLTPGSVYDLRDGSFNFTDPTGLVFGAENNTHPFDRIKETDRENLDLFIHRYQPKWKLPLWQSIADDLSLATLCSMLLVLIVLLSSGRSTRTHQN